MDEFLIMPPIAPPCCATGSTTQQRELSHVYQFDFDLRQCTQCQTYWVWAWREGIGGFEPVTESDTEAMLALPESEMRPFMKRWAASFN